MKLAIVTHNVMRGDGQSRVALEIARHALAQGVQVSLLADHAAPEILALGAEWIPIRPLRRETHLSKVWESARLADRLLKRRGGEFDRVQAFGFTLSEAHSANNSQFVHEAWSRSDVHTSRLRRDAYGCYQWLYTRLNARWEKRAYGQARTVVASSCQIRGQLMEIGVPEARLQVIWNGVDLQEFHPGPADRGALGLPEGVPLALFAGDIRTPRKNLDGVLNALARVPSAHLAVVGEVARSPYPALAARLGLSDRVHFLGFRRDVAALMRAADFFVFPSRYEACSLVLLEAAASGLPLITARTAGGAELLTENCGVVLDDPNDGDALAEALGALAGQPERRRQMGRAARVLAEQHGWTRMAEAYLRLYQDMA